MKIAITTSSFGEFSHEAIQLLKDNKIEFVLNPHGRTLTEDEVIKILDACVGVAAGTEALTARVMDAVPSLKVISRCGIGTDNVDLEAAKERGIVVRNTPDAPTQPVVELVLGLALDLARKFSAMDRDLRQKVWKKRMGNLLSGKKIGIIGFGRIGKRVGRTFSLLDCPVAFYDPYLEGDQDMGHGCGTATKMNLETLLPWADLITLHCPKTNDAKAMLADDELKLMKEGAWIINAARGGLVDEASLYAALNTKHLAGAALDVFVKEPYEGPLSELDNVIITPHIGSYAKESRIAMETETIKNLLSELVE